MQQKNITVSKTARYFISGEATPELEQIWFVCHGYAQLADEFLVNFDSLNNGKHLIIAPEGLHRFYWKGFSDDVVASWMTKIDRADEIHDYVNYLNAVYKEVLAGIKNKQVKINVLGFSQGAATVCRWAADQSVKIDNLILWGGAFPADMDLKKNKDYFNSLNIFFVVGDADQFVREGEIKMHEQLLNDHQINYKLIRFTGKHEVPEGPLQEVAKLL